VAEATAAATAPASQSEPTARVSLFTRAFVALCVVAFLGFSSNFIIQPVLPLLVVDRGGDATLVGLVVAAFSLPSVVLRPFMGRLVDEWSNRGVLLAGTATLAVANAAYLIPGFIPLFIVRIVHGTGWAAFNTGGHSLVGRLAPPARRGEASGIYNLMPGLASVMMPAIGLLLLPAYGFDGAFLVAAAMGAGALLVALFAGVGRHLAKQAATQKPLSRSLLERGAVLPMTLEVLFTSVQALFLTFPPLFALANGIDVQALALYYPVVGGMLVIARAVLARLSDRVGRGPVLVGSTIVASAGLVVASFATDVLMLTIAGMLWALAASVSSPTSMALAMDRSEQGRMGAAMATYSLGFQMGLGVGAAVFGFVIEVAGFPAPFLLALLFELALLGLLAISWKSINARQSPGANVTG
jgi:MFS family permease